MRSAYLCADFGIPIRGHKGASVQVREMVAALAAQGHDVRVFAANPGSGIDLCVEPGQTIALVGATGASKSTLVSLLLRFYDPQEGHILLDGVDLRHLTLASLHACIGIVPQESVLFPTTIRENIAYGRPEATMEEIVAAARAANTHKFIVRLPQEYETVIGERGETLSGGQRQRVAIARAMIRNAPSSSWMSRPPRWTPPRKPSRWSGRSAGARRSSSPTGSRPCARPIRPWCWKAGASWSAGRMRTWSRTAATIAGSWSCSSASWSRRAPAERVR